MASIRQLGGHVRLLAIACAWLLAGLPAGAVQVSVDWDDPTFAWPQTSVPSNFSETYGVANGDVTFTFGGDTGAFRTSSPELRQTPTGGLNPIQNVLHLDLDFAPGSSNQITITIDFTHPGGVSGARFTLFDVDRSPTGSGFWDQVIVQGFDGSSVLNPTSVIVGNPSPAIGNTFIPPNIVTGTSSVANNSDDANATFVFAQGGIRQITILLTYPGTAQDPPSQIVGLHDLFFDTGAANVGPDARDDSVGTDVDTPITIDVLANDIDPEGNPLTISLPSATTTEGGSVSIDDNGTPSVPGDDRIRYTPPGGFEGVDTFTYTVGDGTGLTDSATVTVLIPGSAAQLILSKRATRAEVSAGQIVGYNVEIENTGTLDLTALSIVDRIPPGFTYVADSARLEPPVPSLTVQGSGPVTFGGINVGVGQVARLTYSLSVGGGVAAGNYVNTAGAFIASNQVGLSSSATVSVTGDADFEQSTIVGKVFDDRNGDGLQDPGEEGIPGVRLATVTGLLIETDAYGRFHLAGVDGGFAERGRNFILKVDPATLPDGAEFTTENPRVQRITQGLISRMDFGVRLPGEAASCCRWVERKVGEIYFKADSDTVWPDFFPVLRELADRLRQRGGGQLVLEGVGEARARKVAETLERLLGEDLMSRVRVIQAPEPIDDSCKDGPCVQPQGYEAEIVSSRRLSPSALDVERTRGERDQSVDLATRFRVPLPLGGLVWATEDPTTLDARAAVAGPDRLPVRDGHATVPALFRFYSNYTAFVERGEIVVFGPGDMDRVAPLATLPIELEPYGELIWSPQDLPARPGDEWTFVLRLHDAQGRYDETAPKTIRLVPPEDYTPDPVHGVVRLPAELPEEDDSGDSPADLLDGDVLVFLPPVSDLVREDMRRLYTVRPGMGAAFETLSEADRRALDGIAAEWKDAENVRLRVTGHTDRAPLSREDQRAFADGYELTAAAARVIAEHLALELGLTPDQVEIEGRGGDEPIASNVTTEGRALNRRVEARVTGERVTPRDRGPGEVRRIDLDSGVHAAVSNGLDQAGRVIDATVLADRRRRAQSLRLGRDRDRGRPGEASIVSDFDADSLAELYGANDLIRQTIPIRGSRVRIHGQDVSPEQALRLDGRPVPVDTTGRFAVERLLPPGLHEFEVIFEDGDQTTRRALPVEVTGNHLFYVALGDLTVSGHDVSGNVEALAGNERFEDDVIAEGRFALYLKGKIKGRYLITAQLDSGEDQLEDLLSGLDEENPSSLFRRLDPDRYYPVYGDDSTTYSDVDTQGRFYVRLDWDRSRALWGNYHTGITGNELAWYNRSLYGGKVEYRTNATTSAGESRSEVLAFGSEAQTAGGHSEFRGTGGSLYYLRHKDIVRGSEKARIELRDRDSDRVIENVTLVRGADYEIDEIQGRILLSRPLMQVAGQISPSLIKDEPQDGNRPILIVDYEYVPNGFQADSITAGGRARQWIGDHVALGGTYVTEARDGADYTMAGGDLTLSAGPGTYLKLEYADTEQSQAARFFSDNGGLSFGELTAGGPAARDGVAVAAEARANFRELFDGERDWMAGAWFRETDAGFSVSRRDLGVETTEYGAEMVGEIGERVKLSMRAAMVDRQDDTESQRYGVQSDVNLGSDGTLSTEVRQVRQRQAGDDFVAGTLGAVRYLHRVTDNVDLYATGQVTLDDDQGRYEENDLGTLGSYVRVGERTGLRAEASSGDRGDAGLVGFDHRIGPRHQIYGSVTHSIDRTDAPRSNRVALGQRSRLSDQTMLYTENQFVDEDDRSGVAHVFGLDFAPRPGRSYGVSAQSGELQTPGGVVDRDALGLSAGFDGAALRWSSRAEYRSDSGDESRTQWLTSHRLDRRLNPGLRFLLRFNLADTDDEFDSAADARFVEGGMGLAYRPVHHDRVNLLARYTFLYDLPSLGQGTETDQRSHVLSLEGGYRVNARWELAGKLAQRVGELRDARGSGGWRDSTATFSAVRCNFHVVRAWDLVLELRSLDIDETASTRQGFLAGLDRHFADHFKVGVGYNFTDFSDDLTDLDYDSRGWYVNFVAKY